MFKTLIALVLALASSLAMAAVDVNKASQAELEAISGIGPAMSTKMVDERKKGAFKDWSDLTTRVKGIGDGNSKKYSSGGLTVNGAAYDGQAKRAEKPAKAPKEAKVAKAAKETRDAKESVAKK